MKKECNLDQDYPIDLKTDNLYSPDHSKWLKDLEAQVKETKEQENERLLRH